MNHALPATAPAGRRRFWLTVLTFAIANIAAWLAYHYYFGPGRAHILRVDRFTPGDQATISARPLLEWQFNLDVAPAGNNPPALIQPALAGKWQWRSARNLVFLPDRDLPKATRYTLTIPADRMRTPEGFTLPAAFVAMVNTSPLQVLNVRQAGFEEGRRYILEIEFDDSVIPSDVVSRLKLKDPNGAPLGFQLHGQAVGKTIRVITDSVPPAKDAARQDSVNITCHVDAGLAGIGGPLGLPQPFEAKISVGSTLAATGIHASADARSRPRISLQFNGTPDLAILRSILSVEPAIPFTIEHDYRSAFLEGDFQPATRYAVKIASPPKGANAALYPRPDVLSVFVPDRAPAAWFQNEIGYLGSQGNRTLLAHAVNLSSLRVRLWRVYDTNLVTWRNNSASYREDPREYAKPIAGKTITLKSARNKIEDLRIALDDLLPASIPHDGVFRVTLTPSSDRTSSLVSDDDEESNNSDRQSDSAIVTLSDIALSAKREEHGLTLWATSLSTAKPLDRVRIRAFTNKQQLIAEAQTDASGLCTLSSLHPAEGETLSVILADRATSPTTQPSAASDYRALTWLDLRSGVWDLSESDTTGRPYRRTGHDAYLYTDRGAYRPGETVHLRAIVRRNDGQPFHSIPARWLIRRPDLREWKQFIISVDEDGSAALDLALPDDLTTGRWTAELGLPGATTTASQFGKTTFLIEEFIPNRLKVSAGFAGKDLPPKSTRATFNPDHPITATIQGDYLFGRPASGLQANLTAHLDPATFSPTQFPGVTFGDSATVLETKPNLKTGQLEIAGVNALPDPSNRPLNEAGRASWPLPLKQLIPTAPKSASEPAQFRGPWRLSIEASVQENAGRTVTAANAIQLDSLPWYIGLRPTAQSASSSSFDITLVSPDGALASQNVPLQVTLLSETWNNTMTYRDGHYAYDSHRLLEPIANSTQKITTTAGRATLNIPTPHSGAFILRIDDPAHGALTSLRFIANDGSPWQDNISRQHPERLEITLLGNSPAPAPEKSEKSEPQFKIGQTARALIRSPFPGRLLLTVETDHVLTTRVIEMKEATAEIPLDVTPNLRPNAYITASVIRPVDPNIKWRTHRAYGVACLKVDPADARLTTEIIAPKEVRPLESVDVAIRVTDPAGRPVANAPVTLAAVDQGILALTDFHSPDPLSFFHARRAAAVHSLDIFSLLMPEVPRPDKSSAIGGDGPVEKASHYHSPVTARRVKSIVLFVTLKTDEQGLASTHLSIPEFSGQLRLMAVTHSAQRYGSAESPLLVRSPILVQSTFPRFAAPGDQFNVPVTLFNNGTSPADVTLTARWLTQTTPITFANSTQTTLTLPPVTIAPGKQHVITLPCAVGPAAGLARIQLTAASGADSATETTELPIRPPSPFITTGGYAVLTPDKPTDLTFKDDLLAGTAQTSITLTPIPSLQLPQSLDYLERYPYGCAEQTISTSFPLLYLSQIGPRIAPGVFEKQRVADKVQVAISRLIGMQTADGGIAMWPGNSNAWPWTSVYAAHFIVEARAAGHTVPPDVEKHLMHYVRSLLDRSTDNPELLECQGYAAYVLALAGQPDRAFMNRLDELTRPSAKPAENSPQLAQARLYLALAQLSAGRRDLANDLFPAALPPIRQNYQPAGNIASPIRDRAIYLNTLLTLQPDNPAIPASIQQLASAKWQTTQDIAFAAMAIGKYLKQSQSQTPYQSAQLLQDGKPIANTDTNATLVWKDAGHRTPSPGTPGEGRGEGRTTNQPLVPQPPTHLQAQITGPADARGYLTWIRTGVPRDIPPSADHGITIRRRYLDSHGKPLTSNQIQTGDLILVELTVEAHSAQSNLVIEDLLPAGLEIENPRLQTTANIENHQSAQRQNQREFISPRLDIRDDRLILFAHLPATGVARHTYAARAVVPGTYVIPPARVESMYDPGLSSLWGPGGTLEVKRFDPSTIVDLPRGEK